MIKLPNLEVCELITKEGVKRLKTLVILIEINSNLFFSLFSSKPNNELKFQEELFSVKNSC